MTTRARRMKRALESLGWETGEDSLGTMTCHKCHQPHDKLDKFCKHCGTKARKQKAEKQYSTIWQLERSIAFALGEVNSVFCEDQ